MMEQIKIWKRYLRVVLDIKTDQEAEHETYAEVKSGLIFKGTNLWIMSFAMIISCIGLNINSKAAIIGAMIISPLMGPVFGIGFSLGISDIDLLKLSIKNLTRIVIICIACSTLYYLLNPYHVATDELLSLSNPTLFDILLAFFGGLAGFIAISRKEGNRVLVGVAVATACIPPLCTAGYGLATLQWQYVLGGLYTYSLNSIFICWATYLMTRYLKFTQVRQHNMQRIHIYFIIVGFIALVPGCYLAYKMIVKNNYTSKAEYFIDKEISTQYHVIHHEIDADKKSITVDISNETHDNNLAASLNTKMKNYPLPNTILQIHQSSNNQKLIQEMQREINQLKAKMHQKE